MTKFSAIEFDEIFKTDLKIAETDKNNFFFGNIAHLCDLILREAFDLFIKFKAFTNSMKDIR